MPIIFSAGNYAVFKSATTTGYCVIDKKVNQVSRWYATEDEARLFLAEAIMIDGARRRSDNKVRILSGRRGWDL